MKHMKIRVYWYKQKEERVKILYLRTCTVFLELVSWKVMVQLVEQEVISSGSVGGRIVQLWILCGLLLWLM